MDLRLASRHTQTIHIITFDIADYHNWKKGDRVAINPNIGPISRLREIQAAAGIDTEEEDYTLVNQRTGGRAISRKKDWEVK
ncbi:MAG TPA: hypothetical protein VMI10_12300 [Terriglobales bacterium]|nr:hypothetical protein [Terriglobales bacterium]